MKIIQMQTRELNLFKNNVKQISCALYEKNDNSNYIYISYSTPITKQNLTI